MPVKNFNRPTNSGFEGRIVGLTPDEKQIILGALGAHSDFINFKGRWIDGDEIFKDDIVYTDLDTIRIYYIALCDIKSSVILPEQDTKCWKEFLEVPLNGEAVQEVVIKAPSTAQEGILTQQQINMLLHDDRNFILFDKEVYRLSDKRIDMGYITYTHVGEDLEGHYYIKVITITLDVKSWVLTKKML